MNFAQPRNINTSSFRKLKEKEEQERAKIKARRTAKQFKNALVKALIAALLFPAGLPWRDAINTTIKSYYPLRKDAVSLKFIYATFLTIGTVFLSIFVFKKDAI